MVVKAASTCLHLSQPVLPHSPSSSQALASAVSSPSLKRRCRGDGAFGCRFVQRLDRVALFGTPSSRIHRSRSCDYLSSRSRTSIKRACSASLDAFSDEEFSKKIQELALRFQYSDDKNDNSRGRGNYGSVSEEEEESLDLKSRSVNNFVERNTSDKQELSTWPEIRQEWPERGEEIIPASIERKANSVDLPVSLRMIKRKLQWQEGFREAGESAYCSVKKAFSSMVFIIRELHSYSLQMRELLFYEDLQGILVRVQKEIHASFVWLFQQVFSHTPTLMVYVMILLANYSVYSMGSNAAMAAIPPPASYASVIEIQDQEHQKFDSSSIKSFSVSSSSGKTTSIGGNNGGGGKVRPAASGTDGDGWLDRTDQFRRVVPDAASQFSSLGTAREAESTSGQETREEELSLWNSIVEEASKMQASFRDEAIDKETMQRFVSPVWAKIEPDDYEDYFRTELLYQTSLSEEPNNTLLLANYAQFLYLVAHDNDRAEEYFKKATEAEAKDAEAYSKYASFLWRARNDLWAAEETFLEAISADPSNSYYAANYAHFLWNTGGEDTCFPLSSPDTTEEA